MFALLLLILVCGIGLTALLRPTPAPILERVIEVLNPTATYILPNENRTDLTYISSLMSATPDLGKLALTTAYELVEETVNPCTDDLSSDEPRIVYSLFLQRSKELYRMDASGTQICHLTFDSFMDDQPAWSPDGEQIVFVSNREGYGIYTMRADGSEITKRFDNGTSFSFPRWSPDGAQIIFQATINEQFDLYAITVDGKNLRNLTNDPRLDSAPAWSPDGQFIAFTSDRTFNPFVPNRLAQEANYEIYLMNPNGLQVHRLTSNDMLDFFPTWSPDSLRIAFESSWSNIYVMNKDGTDLQYVTNGNQPIWLPDGENLIFLRNRQIYRRNLVTEDEQAVSAVGGINYMDYWIPRTN